MIIVDAHSKWPKIVEMKGTSAQQTIAELCRIFATYGLPEQVVSDIGTRFISEDFQLFMKSNGIKHNYTLLTISPFLGSDFKKGNKLNQLPCLRTCLTSYFHIILNCIVLPMKWMGWPQPRV